MPGLRQYAGEIIGQTYISEKDGVIEIQGEVWKIKDLEGQEHSIAIQTLKGTRATAQFFRLGNPGGVVTQKTMLQELRKGFEKQGVEVGAVEPRRVSGKRVLALPMSMAIKGGRANLLVYMMQGEKSLYWATFVANAAIWDDARKKFEALIETVKY